MQNLTALDVNQKRVLVRVDMNVPLDQGGAIMDDTKIRVALPTLEYLTAHGAKIILMGHLGNPDGIDLSLSFDVVRKRLEGLLGKPVIKAPDCIGEEVEKLAMSLQPGQVLLLENLRFHKEEMENNQEFAQKLAKLGELYINEAFGTCHRLHASVASVPAYLPHAAGLHLAKEVEYLKKVLDNPVKPMVVIVGGKKVETKAAFINHISTLADWVLVSGLIQKEILEKGIILDHPEKIVAPVGVLDAPDISDETITLFREKIMQAKTIVWNGPFGRFEDLQFCKGTIAIADAIVESKAFSLVGGGETVAFLEMQKMMLPFSHVCAEGGAMLAFLSGEVLPGLKALE